MQREKEEGLLVKSWAAALGGVGAATGPELGQEEAQASDLSLSH